MSEPGASGSSTTQAFPFPIRRCGVEDDEAILRLLRLTLGETDATRKTEEYWDWKHVLSPFGPSYSLCAVDEETGELTGLRTLMWWSFRAVDGTLLRAVRPVDTATHPGYQRRGIFSALTRQAIADLREQGVPFVFNTPNRNSLPGYLKMGWSVVTRWPLYLRPVRWRAILRALLPGAAPGRSPSPSPAAETQPEWSEFRKRNEEELAALIAGHERSRTRVGYRTPRDLAYLDWRYGSHPNVRYLVHTLRDRAGLAGVLIVRPTTGARGLRVLLITEMFLRESSAGAGVRLLRSLIRSRAADYLGAHFAPGTLERSALRRIGFLRAPRRGSTFTARALNPAPHDPLRPDSWDLTLGELEVF